MVGKGPSSVVATLADFVDEQLQGIYTVSFVIVEAVNEDTRRAEVSLKKDRDVIIDNVPIGSPFARSGAGIITPVGKGDEGLLLHAKDPIDQQIQARGEQAPAGSRRFTLEAAILVPLVWLDEDDIPDHETGEYQVALPGDGSVLRMLPDGRVRVEHASGNVIAMDANGAVTIGDEGAAAAVLTENAVIEYEDTGDTGDGTAEPTTKQATIVDPGSEDLNAS